MFPSSAYPCDFPLFTRRIGAIRVSSLILIGVAWVVLTLAFEVGLGRLVLGVSWERLTSDYDMRKDGLMPIGMLGADVCSSDCGEAAEAGCRYLKLRGTAGINCTAKSV